jgi:SnoaL-like domain
MTERSLIFMRVLSLLEGLLVRVQVEDLVTEWARRVDFDAGLGVESLFAEDGVVEFGDRQARGREEIRATYARRRDRGDRTARHITTNLSIEVAHADRAEARSVMVLFADDGAPPLPVSLPLLVQDIFDVCVRDADGVWRFEYRKMTPVFRGDREIALPLPARRAS